MQSIMVRVYKHSCTSRYQYQLVIMLFSDLLTYQLTTLTHNQLGLLSQSGYLSAETNWVDWHLSCQLCGLAINIAPFGHLLTTVYYR